MSGSRAFLVRSPENSALFYCALLLLPRFRQADETKPAGEEKERKRRIEERSDAVRMIELRVTET